MIVPLELITMAYTGPFNGGENVSFVHVWPESVLRYTAPALIMLANAVPVCVGCATTMVGTPLPDRVERQLAPPSVLTKTSPSQSTSEAMPQGPKEGSVASKLAPARPLSQINTSQAIACSAMMTLPGVASTALPGGGDFAHRRCGHPRTDRMTWPSSCGGPSRRLWPRQANSEVARATSISHLVPAAPRLMTIVASE